MIDKGKKALDPSFLLLVAAAASENAILFSKQWSSSSSASKQLLPHSMSVCLLIAILSKSVCRVPQAGCAAVQHAVTSWQLTGMVMICGGTRTGESHISVLL